MKTKSVFAFCALLGALSLVAGEKFESGGFSAEFNGSGVMTKLGYAGMPISNNISLVGEYQCFPDEKKHGTFFRQDWDYGNTAKFRREGDSLVMTNESVLGNEVKKAAVSYKVRCVVNAEKICFIYEVKLNTALQTQCRIFEAQVAMLPGFFGRGAKSVSVDGQESYKIIPEAFNPKFNMGGATLGLSTEKGILTLSGGKDVTMSYVDPRGWGGKNFIFSASPVACWTPEPVVYPVGTVWKWDFSLAFRPKKQESP